MFVILSAAKDLHAQFNYEVQILRFAQDDSTCCAALWLR